MLFKCFLIHSCEDHCTLLLPSVLFHRTWPWLCPSVDYFMLFASLKMWGTFCYSLLVRCMLTSWKKLDCRCCHIKNSLDFSWHISVCTEPFTCIQLASGRPKRECMLVFKWHSLSVLLRNGCMPLCMSHGLPSITVTKHFLWTTLLKNGHVQKPANVSGDLCQC